MSKTIKRYRRFKIECYKEFFSPKRGTYWTAVYGSKFFEDINLTSLKQQINKYWRGR